MLELQNINYSYQPGTAILNNLNRTFRSGRVYAIVGSSGCGKTTLLSLMGGLDIPDSGRVLYNGKPLMKKDLPEYRKKDVSFIFQSYNLIDYLTAEENLKLVSPLSALPVLEKVGLNSEIAKRYVWKLSGGQQQRVAVARALISDSSLLLADEPTGNLDDENAHAIFDLLLQYAHGPLQGCVIAVTHSPVLAQKADVVLELEDGVLKETDSL
ncbi:MAG: ABC transporter ATP-binding protein [Lachnospiraceae bacterium]|jgi:putative ABC transport system ATP-binding protein|nr:ABC transporter ATP-binding protein [Lachnospiraceae bacterium]